MPVKSRSTKQRKPQFSEEALRLFCEIERLKPSKRFNDPQSKRLAELLDLVTEYWTVKHVNDPGPRPTYQPHQSENWEACRAVRLQLLEATGLSPTRKAAADPLRNDSDQS